MFFLITRFNCVTYLYFYRRGFCILDIPFDHGIKKISEIRTCKERKI